MRQQGEAGGRGRGGEGSSLSGEACDFVQLRLVEGTERNDKKGKVRDRIEIWSKKSIQRDGELVVWEQRLARRADWGL